MGNSSGKEKDPASPRASTKRRVSSEAPSELLASEAPSVPTATRAQAIPVPSKIDEKDEDNDQLNVFGSPLLSPSSLEPLPPVSEASSAPARISTSQNEKQAVKICWQDGGNNVQVVGSFSEWKNPVQLTKRPDGVFETTLMLKPGQYEYKFLVDNTWRHDSHVTTMRNSFGSVNNMLEVLAMESAGSTTMVPDSMTNLTKNFDEFTEDVAEARAASPPGTYAQYVPDIGNERPPKLPPQLLQCQLNADPPNADPTQLPAPNHVMLNHLYALSIKDNVIVMGASHRYRQKFVTTVIYKPLTTD
eukprot:TRINITY_DN10736_c0_g4_i1.p1 TRINITY_DN10736_c0_g4~~TRINITY_DN10736_c0_g4_i1.p1  ORF type:complete len:303 (+),score=64.92 TRINITY_DN10736_c0_g4_i1:120-1028(+)